MTPGSPISDSAAKTVEAKSKGFGTLYKIFGALAVGGGLGALYLVQSPAHAFHEASSYTALLAVMAVTGVIGLLATVGQEAMKSP